MTTNTPATDGMISQAPIAPAGLSNPDTQPSGQPKQDDNARPIDQINANVQEGLKNIKQDGGSSLLEAVQPIFAEQLKKYVGQKLPDGSVVYDTPKLIAAPQHPSSINHMVPIVSFPVKTPDGKTGTVTQPWLGPNASLSEEFEKRSQKAIQPWKITDVMNYLHGLNSIATAIKTTPGAQDKINQADPRVSHAIAYGAYHAQKQKEKSAQGLPSSPSQGMMSGAQAPDQNQDAIAPEQQDSGQ